MQHTGDDEDIVSKTSKAYIDKAMNYSNDGDEEEDDKGSGRRPSDPLGGPAGS